MKTTVFWDITLMMEAVGASETLVGFPECSWRNIPVTVIFNLTVCDNTQIMSSISYLHQYRFAITFHYIAITSPAKHSELRRLQSVNTIRQKTID